MPGGNDRGMFRVRSRQRQERERERERKGKEREGEREHRDTQHNQREREVEDRQEWLEVAREWLWANDGDDCPPPTRHRGHQPIVAGQPAGGKWDRNCVYRNMTTVSHAFTKTVRPQFRPICTTEPIMYTAKRRARSILYTLPLVDPLCHCTSAEPLSRRPFQVMPNWTPHHPYF